MNVTVRAFADFREILGCRKEVAVSAGSTVGTLLEMLARTHPGLEGGLFGPAGQLQPLVNALVNGRNIQFLDGLDTPLTEGDVVSLFSPVAGG
ncbi:MAG: Sulfur carrier protein CysO [Syntrophaceae bacterium PtaU1.Bin231]|nr:MAG: Sulfur carrier protein CysO [Syntrophaceae bacterium PtaU1.Bin231]